MTATLPPEFADLAPLLADWAFPTENERSERRWRASKADFDWLYGAVMPRLPAILEHLSAIPATDVPDAQRPLLYLMLSFAECAPHVELYRGSSRVPNSFDAHRFTATRGSVAG